MDFVLIVDNRQASSNERAYADVSRVTFNGNSPQGSVMFIGEKLGGMGTCCNQQNTQKKADSQHN